MAALLLHAAAVGAQVRDTMPHDSTVRRIEPVVIVGARAPSTVGGASSIAVTPESLNLPPAPFLEQVLREMPFVLVRQNARGEMEISLRGSESRQVAVMLDGLPLTLGWDHRTDPSLVPLTGVGSVALVRGLSSVLHGPNVLGGIVELQLAGAAASRPQLVLGTGIDQYAARVVTVGGDAPLATRAGTITLRGGAAYHERDGFALSRRVAGGDAGTGDPGRDDEGSLRTNSDLRQVDGFAALRLESATGHHVGLTATGYEARRGVPPELHLRDPRLWRYPDVSRRLAIASAGARNLRTPVGRGRLDASAGINYGDLRIESFESRAYERVIGLELGDERTATGRVTGAHTLPGNGELRGAFTIADVRYDEALDATPTSRYRQRLSSAGAEVQWPVAARALLSGGLVYDEAKTPESGGKPALGTLSDWGWRAGATLLAFGEAVRLHTSVSRRARFPALRELYSGALDRFEPNPELRPERLLGAEIGATVIGGLAARAGLTLQAVAFHHSLDDAVVRVSTASRRFRRINRDEIRSSGLELLAGWLPRASGGTDASPVAAAGFSLTGDLLVQRVRVYHRTLTQGAANERRPEHQPEVRGSIDLGVPLAFALQGFAGFRYTGRQFCVHPDLGQQTELRGQSVGDAALSRRWALGPGAGLLRALRVTLALDNVTDATVYDQCGLPQPGRTLRLGAQLR